MSDVSHLKKSFATLVLVTGMVTTLLVTWLVRNDIMADQQNEFEFAAEQVELNIERRLEAYELILRGGAALFEASGTVDRAQWRQYVQKLQADAIVPGVQGIGYVELIPVAQREAHIAAVRAEGFADYQITPPGERDVYTSIIYLEPFADRNLRAFGFDMFTEPVRRQAMEEARDSGEASLSGQVTLVQETEIDAQPGTLMYVPVYRPSVPVSTSAERRAALLGWVYSPYRMRDLMTGILQGWDSTDGMSLHLHVHDGALPVPDNLLYSSSGDASHPARTTFTYSQVVQLHGRTWTLEFDSSEPLTAATLAPMWISLFSGMLASTLLFYLINSVQNTRANAERMARGLTRSLRASQQALQESEFRWRFALEGSRDGVWDWDVKGGKVLFSREWKAMLGYSEDEIGDSLDEWEKRIHPDDLTETLRVVDAYLKGESPVYSSEHRVLCKDGSYKWINDRGIVVSRASDGSPLRMIGTHRDIDATKNLERRLRERTEELLEAQRIAGMGSWQLEVATGEVRWSEELNRIYGLVPGAPPPPLAEHRRFYDQSSWDKLNQALARCQQTGEPYEVELLLTADDGVQRSIYARGEVIRNAAGEVELLRGTAVDITQLMAARLRIESLGNLYAALSESHAAIIHSHSEQDLLKRVCEIVVDYGRMKMAWIGMVDETSGRVVPVYSAGEGQEYLDGIEISIHENDPHGQGATGSAIRTNTSVWFDDFQGNPATLPWRARAMSFGWEASGSIPLCRNGKAVGALTFYSPHKNWFSDEIQQLLERMAQNISFAIDNLEVTARSEAYKLTLIESEQRFQALIEQSIAGAFIVQQDRIVYANPRMAQILGYPDATALQGLQPTGLIAQAEREAAQRALAALPEHAGERRDLLFNALRQDGTKVAVGLNISAATYNGAPALIGTLQDITDRKIAEEQISRYARQLEHTFIQTVGLANTLSEMRDPYTVGHERRVAQIALAIGAEMGLSGNQLEGLRVGAYLHDVGKMKVPAEILAKPSRLTANEYALIKEHARAGYDILKEVDFPWPVATIALQHHERMDGSGYPQGLKGEEIILEARIVAVADVIESMSSHRPYRPGLGMDKALEEIERGIGTLYDPVPATIALRLFRDENILITESH